MELYSLCLLWLVFHLACLQGPPTLEHVWVLYRTEWVPQILVLCSSSWLTLGLFPSSDGNYEPMKYETVYVYIWCRFGVTLCQFLRNSPPCRRVQLPPPTPPSPVPQVPAPAYFTIIFHTKLDPVALNHCWKRSVSYSSVKDDRILTVSRCVKCEVSRSGYRNLKHKYWRDGVNCCHFKGWDNFI